jgi:thiol:disulfide interchange protein DsbD
MAQRIITLILLLCSTSAFAGLFDAPGRSDFVPADQAFAFDFQQSQRDVNLTWQIKEGYYLYRQQIKLTPANATLAAWSCRPARGMRMSFTAKVRFTASG